MRVGWRARTRPPALEVCVDDEGPGLPNTGQPVRAVLHHQAGRLRHRARAVPADRRGARRHADASRTAPTRAAAGPCCRLPLRTPRSDRRRPPIDVSTALRRRFPTRSWAARPPQAGRAVVRCRSVSYTGMHPWHDIYVDDHMIAQRLPRRHRSADGQQEQVRARQGDRACCGWTASSTAPCTTRPTTASSPARSATTAIRSTPSCWARNRSIR